ncbi:hypothetical protein F5B20DRAFT_455474 [Whalleya microplaca]|nr:hypothetical protein F5B20DRAFT_455474 [Whalleya microplaca]
MDYKSAGPVLVPTPHNGVLSVSEHSLHNSSGSDDLSSLPAGYPTQLGRSFAWTGAQSDHELRFIYNLTETELVEIRSAKDQFKARELDGDLVNRENFPLPTLGPKLDELSEDLYNSTGLCIIRGVDPQEYCVEDLTIIWLGIQAYIADRRGCQDHRGNMLVHIIADNSSETKQGHHRHSTSAISFHNEEAGDVVAWLTRSTATTGGKCIVASVYTVYNILAAHRPDIIRTLAKSDWPFAL